MTFKTFFKLIGSLFLIWTIWSNIVEAKKAKESNEELRRAYEDRMNRLKSYKV